MGNRRRVLPQALESVVRWDIGDTQEALESPSSRSPTPVNLEIESNIDLYLSGALSGLNRPEMHRIVNQR
jgi:hypothetical protein